MRICLFSGTRPEVVKLAPVRSAFARLWPRRSNVEWVSSGQHGDLARAALKPFGQRFDVEFDRKSGGALGDLVGDLSSGADRHFAKYKPDLVLVQGDTASAFAGALAAFHRQIPVGHIEAGLRSFDNGNPFPEEGYRRMIANMAAMHFAPTPRAARNLYDAGIDKQRVLVTGNTVVDAVNILEPQTRAKPAVLARVSDKHRIVLVTLHRREAWGPGIEAVCEALRRIVRDIPDAHVVLPMHPNPQVRDQIKKMLSGHSERVTLCDALDQVSFLSAVRRASLIITDSGGVQEEAPCFGVPVLVARKSTERMEAIESGQARLVGHDAGAIATAATWILQDSNIWKAMARAYSPFGDGKASDRIVDASGNFLAGKSPYLAADRQFVPVRV